MREKLLLIDGSSLLSQNYYGNLPKSIKFAKTEEERAEHYHEILHNSKGQYTNAVYGMTQTLIKILKNQNPSHLAVAWDLNREHTFRRDIYPQYKANRSQTPFPLKEQFALMQNVLKEMNVVQFADLKYEADDYIGSLSKKFEGLVPVYILTKDRDALQLVSDFTRLWLMYSEEKAEELMSKYYSPELIERLNVPDHCFELTPILVESEFGMKPEGFIMYKALAGDSGDNIPGVKGVGEKSAIPLVNEYETVDNLYLSIKDLNSADEKGISKFWKECLGIKRPPITTLLKESTENEILGEEAAKLSETLGTIKTDIPIDAVLEDFKVNIHKENTKRIFEELEFKSINLDF